MAHETTYKTSKHRNLRKSELNIRRPYNYTAVSMHLYETLKDGHEALQTTQHKPAEALFHRPMQLGYDEKGLSLTKLRPKVL